MENEKLAVMEGKLVTRFPRMSKDLAAIARSGRHLFGQWHMMQASMHGNEPDASVRIRMNGNISKPAWVSEHMAETRGDWYDDCLAHDERTLVAKRERAEKRDNK
jgi:hypothetical protein